MTNPPPDPKTPSTGGYQPPPPPPNFAHMPPPAPGPQMAPPMQPYRMSRPRTGIWRTLGLLVFIGVIGFNLLHFDYRVLQPYSPNIRLASLPTLDMLLDIQRNLGFRLSLDNLAGASLDAAKTADGVKSVEWFRNGELDKVAEYCKADVDITRRVFEFGRDNGFVFYKSKLGSKLKTNVNWR